MNSPRLKASPGRLRRGLLALCLLIGTGVVFWWAGTRRQSHRDQTSTLRAVIDPALDPATTAVSSGVAIDKKGWLEAVRKSVRGLDPNTILPASVYSHHKLQLALDELAAIEPKRGLSCFRHHGAQSAAELSAEIQRLGRLGGRALFPVFYVKGAPRVAGSRRIVTGEIVAVLNPGVGIDDIAREYDLGYFTPPPESRLVHFLARSAFEAIDVVPRLVGDARVALADHDFISFVQPKAIDPNDPLFRDQWHLRNNPSLDPRTVLDWDINLYPHFGNLGELTPVWGDFAVPGSGVRGRGVRVGLVDDGIDLNHSDLQGSLADGHHSYDIVPQVSTPQVPFPPPRIVPGETFQASHQKYFNDAHATNLAGLIAAVGNNSVGSIGVAPESEVVAIRALSWYEDDSGDVFQVPTWLNSPGIGDLVAPTADTLFAAAYLYLYNTNSGYSGPGRLVYPGTPQQTQLPGFADPASGNMIAIKNNSWGAPDVGIFGGPGPEVAGVNVQGQPPEIGARRKAVEEGRGGLGTIFVNAAGNGRSTSVENVNSDGWANARETICVGALALPLQLHFDSTTTHHVGVYSEWGACVMVSAPGGGPYFFSRVTAPQRIYDGTPTRGGLQSTPMISTTDWTINEPANPDLDPPQFEDVYGLNRGEGADYPDPHYTRTFSGTSAAAAIVSGVVALMLEANPRLSWLDVQNMLIRSATNHIDPVSYANNPTLVNPPRNIINGVDIADPEDVTPIERDWKKNGGHVWFNHKYGAGMVSARMAINMARTSPLLPRQIEHTAHNVTNLIKKDLTEASADGVPVDPYTIDFLSGAPPDFIVTHATVKFDRIATTFIGDIFVNLVSPSGMESVLMEPHFDGANDLTNWTFTSVRHWGETGSGTWKVTISDNLVFDAVTINPDSGNRVTLTLHGYTKPPVPVITKPESTVAAQPTPVQYTTPGQTFSYTMTANNNPTVWNISPLTPLPPGLQLEAVPLNNTYIPTRRIIGTPTVAGRYLVEVRAENAALYSGRVPPPAPQPGASIPHYLLIEIPDCYTDWALFFFGPDAQTPPTSLLAAGGADPDGDGFINSVEFALGMHPLQRDAENALILDTDAQGRWRLTYKRFTNRGNPSLDVLNTYELQTSTDLQTWVNAAHSGPNALPTRTEFPAEYEVSEGTEVIIPIEPCGTYIPVTVTQLGHTPPLFFRLRITPYRAGLAPLPPPPPP